MRATCRPYRHATDYAAVGRLLVRTCGVSADGHRNWPQPRWEYMHSHPFIWNVDLSRIGVWECDGEIVAVAHFEDRLGDVYCELDPAAAHLKAELLGYAEEFLRSESGGRRSLEVHLTAGDASFEQLAAAQGYQRTSRHTVMSALPLPEPFPPIPLPDGFRVQSLADDNDLARLHRLLWRGFNHGDEPPDDGLAERRLMQSAPNYRHELNVVAVAPDGQFVAYCGMWYEPTHRYAYVEPVCTDPAYRRRGLARAAVLEGVRRCGELGADTAWVGTDLPLYLSLGFVPRYGHAVWRREW